MSQRLSLVVNHLVTLSLGKCLIKNRIILLFTFLEFSIFFYELSEIPITTGDLDNPGELACMNYVIFLKLCDRMRFEVNCAKSHFHVISDGWQ